MAGVGVIILAVTGLYAWDLYRCRAARPLDMKVDFSKAGEFAGVLTLEYPYGYGGYDMELLLPVSIPAELERPDAIADLRVSFSIAVPKRSDGNDVREFRGESGKLVRGKSGYSVDVVHYCYGCFEEGPNPVTIRVEQGAAALAGVEQRLVAGYLIDCEVLGVVQGVGWAVMAFTGAGLVAGFTLAAMRWKSPA
ncbi:MAG: hypothetical protein ACM3VT_20340 [Solirubrobacterales bacterium]